MHLHYRHWVAMTRMCQTYMQHQSWDLMNKAYGLRLPWIRFIRWHCLALHNMTELNGDSTTYCVVREHDYSPVQKACQVVCTCHAGPISGWLWSPTPFWNVYPRNVLSHGNIHSGWVPALTTNLLVGLSTLSISLSQTCLVACLVAEYCKMLDTMYVKASCLLI